MAELWKKDILYSILRPAVDLCTRRSFRKLKICGKDRIPLEGMIIFAPNHCNALLDALAILLVCRGPIAFGCRADIFRNKTAARLLRFLKILPVPRIRDGVEALKSGRASSDEAADALAHGLPYTLFSEGTHRAMRSLLPIRKGIFRVAADALARAGEVQDSEPLLYVVPVGLEYSDYYHYRSNLLINIGEPVDIGLFLKENASVTPAGQFKLFAELLKSRLSSQITFLEDDEEYPSKINVLNFLSGGCRGSSERHLRQRQELASSVERAAKVFPREFRSLAVRSSELEALRLRFGVGLESFGCRHPFLRGSAKLLASVLLLPYFICCALLSLPVWLTAELISLRLKDKVFANSIRFAVRFFGMMILVPLWCVAAFLSLPALPAAGALLLALPSVSLVYDWCALLKSAFSDLSCWAHPSLSDKYRQLVDRFRTLAM